MSRWCHDDVTMTSRWRHDDASSKQSCLRRQPMTRLLCLGEKRIYIYYEKWPDFFFILIKCIYLNVAFRKMYLKINWYRTVAIIIRRVVKCMKSASFNLLNWCCRKEYTAEVCLCDIPVEWKVSCVWPRCCLRRAKAQEAGDEVTPSPLYSMDRSIPLFLCIFYTCMWFYNKVLHLCICS